MYFLATKYNVSLRPSTGETGERNNLFAINSVLDTNVLNSMISNVEY